MPKKRKKMRRFQESLEKLQRRIIENYYGIHI